MPLYSLHNTLGDMGPLAKGSCCSKLVEGSTPGGVAKGEVVHADVVRASKVQNNPLRCAYSHVADEWQQP